MDSAPEPGSRLENEAVKKWKAEGRPVVGYTCLATPVELLDAAGVLPYRVRGLGESRTDLADARLSRFNCGFCRSCLQLGLSGAYDFLDGMIETNGCDHLRGMIENWRRVKEFGFFHYLRVPHLTDADSLAYFTEELRRMRRALEEKFAVKIEDEALRERIRGEARVREKLRALQTMRERPEPAFSGADAMRLYLAVTTAPAGQREALLDEAISARPGHRVEGPRARLLLGGSATDEIELLEGIESMGGAIVADFLCYGARAYWAESGAADADPIAALARLYLDNLLCPRMFADFPRRRDRIIEAVRRSRADGAILVHNKFCDVHGVDNVALRIALEREGVPVLQLEKEYGSADLGRVKTRVQAFLERIGGSR
jgi:benzoyl-CoA reductase subunit C